MRYFAIEIQSAMAYEGLQDSRIGQTVSHYRLIKKLGSGGMGVVYKAQDLVLERLVALKFLAARRRGDASRQRLLEEARAASSLDHPNLCTIFESEETPEGDLFFAMTLCEGETLGARLRRGPAELAEALALVSQVAAGLAHAHARGVVHRDVKPSNLILAPSGQVKIVDFGIAVREGRPRLTRPGAAVGTVAYMSPEQLLGKPVDRRTDLWSLGVVLYELLTGSLPFASTTEYGYAAAVLSTPPEPLALHRPGLPEGIESLLGQLLARDPADRGPSAEELARQLQILEEKERRPAPLSLSRTEPTVTLSPAPPPLLAAHVHPRVAEVFIGRERELSEIAGILLRPGSTSPVAAVCALHGMPGVGKSFLADRFALLYSTCFPGGYLRLILDPKSPAHLRTLLRELADRLGVPGGARLAERIGESLCLPRVLLHVENVDSLAAEVTAGHLLRDLHGVTALVTGRLHDLGLAFGWRRLRVTTLDEETALRQLWSELGWQPATAEEGIYRELVRDLGHLPLALHLASGHLRSGRSVTGFLRLLRKRRLDLTPAERAELLDGASEGARKVLATSFALSVDLLREQAGAESPTAQALLAGLRALGHAPLSGFGRSLGAALAGLGEEDFEELVFETQKLGLLLPVSREERLDGAWCLHPLVAEFLREEEDAAPVFERMTAWFLARFPDGAPGEEADQGRRWREVRAETAALTQWLPRVPPAERYSVRKAALFYPPKNGPFHLWLEFCETALRDLNLPKERSDFLWTLATVALRYGLLERGLAAAEERLQIDVRSQDEFEIAMSLGLLGDVQEARGLLEEALAVWQRQLPILERLGEEREHALTLYRFTRVFKYQGRLDEASELLRERILPVFERIGDNRSRALALGSLADILQIQGDLEAALKIRETEEMPIYERLGESRSQAITIGKIAGILHARGQNEEALRMAREREQPIYEQLGEARELAVCRGRIASILQSLGRTDEAIRVRETEQLPILEKLGSAYDLSLAQEGLALLYLERRLPGDRERAAALLRLALDGAEQLSLPSAERLRARIEEEDEVEAPPP
jgi:serine/threonine protein kinase/tetratricopeptide (TPR) repeat protein